MMWLFILTIFTAAVLFVSFIICEKDIMHPAVVFNIFFLISELTCICFMHEYSIVLHYRTVFVLGMGELIFLAISIMSRYVKAKVHRNLYEELVPSVIKVDKKFKIIILLCQIISILSFLYYLRIISLKYAGSADSIGNMINLYDQANKFFSKELATVPIPLAYRVSNPLGVAGAHIFLYILINNWIVTRKVDKYCLLSVILLIGIYTLNGSRTPIFRLITIALILYYILYFKKKLKKINPRFFLKLVVFAIITVFILQAMLYITGRLSSNGKFKLTDFLFVYLGAPIVNLDNWLMNPIKVEKFYIPGVHVFSQIFSIIENVFHIANLHGGNILLFQSNSDGKFLGNVYTMYYPFVYDFGMLGVIPLTAIIAFYYCFTYDRMFKKQISSQKVCLRLFFYSYLFNDLIMSIFSARFFETILDIGTIKLFIISYLIVELFLKKRIPIIKKKVSFKLRSSF